MQWNLSMSEWTRWFHVNGNTYGTWLRGDPRGWRARHHREHVEGDYKNPPPRGTYDRLLARSRQLMKRSEVHLTPEARKSACSAMVEALLFHHVQLLTLSMDGHHFHLLARFLTPKPTDFNPWASRADEKRELALARHFAGIAKKQSARALSESRIIPEG